MRAVRVREYGGTPVVAEIRREAGSPVCSDQMALYQEVLPVRTPFREVPGVCRIWMAAAFMLGAIARDTLGDPDAAGRALQRALDNVAMYYDRLVRTPDGSWRFAERRYHYVWVSSADLGGRSIHRQDDLA